MTREEARNRIDAIIAKHEIDDVYVTITNFKDYDALRIARKTLEQEPCEDCISREEVIKAIDKHTFETDDGVCLDDDITCILEDTPSIQPKPKTDVLDKIREEIEQEYLAEGHLSDYWDGIDKCLQIVDKYTVEKE